MVQYLVKLICLVSQPLTHLIYSRSNSHLKERGLKTVRSCHIFTDIRPQALAPPSWNDCSRTASFATGSCLSLFCYSNPTAFYVACSLSNRNLFTQSKKVIKCHATSWSLSEQSPGPEVDPTGEAWLMVSGPSQATTRQLSSSLSTSRRDSVGPVVSPSGAQRSLVPFSH